jgi:hypothetical protein
MAHPSAKRSFRELAQELMAANPAIAFEWRDVPSAVAGDRTDLICSGKAPREVWVTLRDDSIAVGTGNRHTDFESFGRKISVDQIAKEAFAEFVKLLRDNGLLGPR